MGAAVAEAVEIRAPNALHGNATPPELARELVERPASVGEDLGTYDGLGTTFEQRTHRM
jgi:hypothetical protein